MTPAPHDEDELASALTRQGLRPSTVKHHAELLSKALHGGSKPQFSIIDTCRPDNGGLLPSADVLLRRLVDGISGDSAALPARGFVAFVPAAGAASRYSQPLATLIEALEALDDTSDPEALSAALSGLRAAGAASWPLPDRVKEWLAGGSSSALDAAARGRLLQDLQLPKALMPCVAEGDSFLEMKHAEHGRLAGLEGEIYVTPSGMQATFAAALARTEQRPGDASANITLKAAFLEQGPALSTIRFDRDGVPLRDEAGDVSLVPAGHGALASLFPEAGRHFSAAHSLFIRNVDNVMGTSAEAMAATAAFLRLHTRVLDKVTRIRRYLAADQLADAADVATQLLALHGDAHDDASQRLACDLDQALIAEPCERALWEVQHKIFHLAPGGPHDRARLQRLYDRPLNTMGQVPNTANDVGGTPCFVKVPDEGADKGCSVKVCIEVPHVSEADRRAFLANPEKATHFNPVFVAAELIKDESYYESRNRNFWLMAEKTHRGQPVVYFETVLYELLGNGDLANALFVEVPRLVFNPHKTLKDAVNRSVRDWLPG